MNYKIKNSFKKSKMAFIIAIAIWIALSILLSAPLAVSIVDATHNGNFNLTECINNYFSGITSVGENLGKIFTSDYIGTFGKIEGYVSIGVLILFVIGLIKSMPKNEYTDIEHGSSDWATGEQYSVLSKKKGIILAEKHYLPVDKRGNVNVLVVGRIRFSENLPLTLFQMHISF